jgi:flavin-dependent dehydrogenase
MISYDLEPPMNPNVAILIIGGGPAGAACAIRLRQHGIDVELAEQQQFPRSKVCGCCLGLAGLDALQTLQLREPIVRRGAALDSWRGSIGSFLTTVSLPGGIAISRQALDTRLLQEAEARGATVRHPCRVKINDVDDQHVTISLQQNQKSEVRRYDCVVVAAGLSAAGVSRFLPWIQPPSGPFGVSFVAAPDTRCDNGVIYMACDRDGYVGLVRLENGWVDVAAALTSGAASARLGTPVQRVMRILADSKFSNLQLQAPNQWMTTPPLRRRRLAGKGRILAIGDAAGYVEPFTGEGMTWAMQSGIAAADRIAEAQNRFSGIGERWTQTYTVSRRQRLLCQGVTTALRWTPARYLAGRVLSTWPALASPLVNRLNSPSIAGPTGGS